MLMQNIPRSQPQERISTQQYRALISQGSTVRTTKRRNKEEEDLQRACVEWAVLHKAKYPILKWLHHSPNGGKRPRGEAGKLKALGVKKGYPDLTIPRKSGKWCGLAAELKSSTGKVSDDQQEWLNAFQEDGWLTGVVRSLDEWIELFEDYANARA